MIFELNGEYIKNLNQLIFHSVMVYHSEGCESQAKVLGSMADMTADYLERFFTKRPDIRVFVLSVEDWKKREPNQQYGSAFIKPSIGVHYGTEFPKIYLDSILSLAKQAPRKLQVEFLEPVGGEGADFETALTHILDYHLLSTTLVHELAPPILRCEQCHTTDSGRTKMG